MSKYQLTEAYGELYNQRLTEASFYDNLRFVDYLQSEEIEEVMESLIWEFMDYGDSLEEAVDTLEIVFGDDEIICEAVSGAWATYSGPKRSKSPASFSVSGQTQSPYERYGVNSDSGSSISSAKKGRLASRASVIRGAIGGAMRSVKGAMKTAHKKIRDRKTQLKKTGSETVEKAQAALTRVGRGGRRAMNAISGGITGAKAGFNAPLPGPKSPSTPTANFPKIGYSSHPGKTLTPYQERELAKQRSDGNKSYSERFPGATQAAALRKKTSEEGRTIAPTPKATTTAPTQKPPLPRAAVTAPAPRTFGSSKNRAKMEKNKEAYEKAKQKLNASVDYDLLTQYMIEDLISEGYAESELQAVSILEDMTEQNLNEFANLYLQD